MLNITYFSFHRDFKDGTRIWLCSNPDWTQYLYKFNYCTINSFDTKKIANKNLVYILWDSLIGLLNSKDAQNAYATRLQHAKNYFNINNGFTIIRYNEFYKDFFNFATTTTNNITADIYFNNLDILLAFSLYFNDVAAPLIQKAANERIFINKTTSTINDSSLTLSCNHCVMTHKNQHYFLTFREEECLALFAYGKTAKEIAKILGLSNRTVENYINTIKEKLGCHLKTELTNIYFANNQYVNLQAVLGKHYFKNKQHNNFLQDYLT